MAKERRAGLGILDRLVLFAAWLVTCGIVYLLGLYVGQGIQERRIGVEDRMLRLPVTSKPPPEGLRPKSDSDLTFYDTLVQPPGTAARADRVARPPAPGAPGAAPPETGPADGTQAAAAKPAPAAPAERPAASPPPTLSGARAAAPRPADVPPATTPRAPAAPPATPAPASPPAPATARSAGGGFTVLATPTRSKDEADILAQKLRGKGYDVMVVRVLRDGDVWYRVRIGRYGSAEQATEAMRSLREREGVPHVFVATE
jgi:cell division septation protein DedD